MLSCVHAPLINTYPILQTHSLPLKKELAGHELAEVTPVELLAPEAVAVGEPTTVTVGDPVDVPDTFEETMTGAATVGLVVTVIVEGCAGTVVGTVGGIVEVVVVVVVVAATVVVF